MEYRLSVQCTHPESGRTGCFIHDTEGHSVSPLFADLAAALPWMYKNGWKLDEYIDGLFIPWRVSRGMQ